MDVPSDMQEERVLTLAVVGCSECGDPYVKLPALDQSVCVDCGRKVLAEGLDEMLQAVGS